MKEKKSGQILFLLTIVFFLLQVNAVNLYSTNYSDSYNSLMSTANSNGFAKVIVKIRVDKFSTLIAESNSYDVRKPGENLSYAMEDSALSLEDAIMQAAYNVLANLNNSDYKVNHYFSTIPYIALDVSPESLAILNELPEVLSIEEDTLNKLVLPTEGSEGSKSISSDNSDLGKPMLDNTTGIIGADTVWGMGYTGSGWYVAVLDTGIRSSHAFFTGKTIVESCYSAAGHCPGGLTEKTGVGSAVHYPSTYSGWDHGTHVAGIATGNNGSLYGVAKDADIIAIQIFSKFDDDALCGGGDCVLTYSSDQLKGLERVYNLRGTYSISSVNMSIGGGNYSTACDTDARKTAIDNLRTVGIATVIATGNDSYCGFISSPACISTSIAIGASTDADLEASFNNWHPSMQKLFAPGVSIYSSTGDSDTSYQSWGGTSMATPHVAGAWALMKQANPTGTVTALYDALESTGTSITTGCPDGGNRPRINVDLVINTFVSKMITVTSPNGSENWDIGSTKNITWTATGLTNNVKLTLWKDDVFVGLIVKNINPSAGTYTWTVGNHTTGTASSGTGYKIKIREQGGDLFTTEDDSDTSFTLSSVPTISVTSPNGGEDLSIGSIHNISWTASGLTNDVKLTLWKDDVFVGLIVKNIDPSAGTYSWTVGNHTTGTATSGTGYKIKIREQGGDSFTTEDNSDTSFTLNSSPTITVTSPNGGESWLIGSTHDITWTAGGLTNPVKITLWKDDVFVALIVKNITPSDGTYSWTIGAYVAGTGYKIKIREQGGDLFTTEDLSDIDFSLYD